MEQHHQEQVLPAEEGNDGPERFPTQLLSQSASARQAHFEHCLIEHPFLAEAVLSVQQAICMPGAEEGYRRLGSMLLVMGPSRVGKTTLIHLLEQELLRHLQERMQRDTGFIPFVSITTDGSGTGRFDWKDYYLSILQQLQDPFLRVKKMPTATRDLREAAEEALLHRKTEVVIVDEAHHLTKARSVPLRRGRTSLPVRQLRHGCARPRAPVLRPGGQRPAGHPQRQDGPRDRGRLRQRLPALRRRRVLLRDRAGLTRTRLWRTQRRRHLPALHRRHHRLPEGRERRHEDISIGCCSAEPTSPQANSSRTSTTWPRPQRQVRP